MAETASKYKVDKEWLPDGGHSFIFRAETIGMVKWIDKTQGRILVEKNANHRFELNLDEEGVAYFNTPQCTCKPIPVLGLNVVMIGDKKRCPIHG